ncbi:hypothetical protein QI113_12185 [Staphylococcus saprophyticus]|uniref:hypothetical protein n=1 Tax=Staphylococcus saprophyticus TaxID=29385 RepID=UPI0029731AE2|nr:hypothetical protein [Staphylococcus saprophyticus]
MEKFKRAIFSLFTITLLTVPLTGCGNDEYEKDSGKEKNGVHKPEDDIQSTDEKEEDQNL